jgi:hypothetical protein
MNLTDSELKLVARVVREYELYKLRAKFGLDKEGLPVKLGEGTHLVNLLSTIVRFDETRETAI